MGEENKRDGEEKGRRGERKGRRKEKARVKAREDIRAGTRRWREKELGVCVWGLGS